MSHFQFPVYKKVSTRPYYGLLFLRIKESANAHKCIDNHTQISIKPLNQTCHTSAKPYINHCRKLLSLTKHSANIKDRCPLVCFNIFYVISISYNNITTDVNVNLPSIIDIFRVVTAEELDDHCGKKTNHEANKTMAILPMLEEKWAIF